MLLNTQNLLKKKKLLEKSNNQNKTNGSFKQNQHSVSTSNLANLYLGSFKNSCLESPKDFVLVKFLDGYNSKVSHASVPTRSILKDDDILEEIERNQTCKVMFNEKILSAVVMCKGSQEKITQIMESFCNQFYKETLNGKKNPDNENLCENLNPSDNKSQLVKIAKEIQDKEMELNSLKIKYDELKRLTSLNDKIILNVSPKKLNGDNIKKQSALDKQKSQVQDKTIKATNIKMDKDYPMIPLQVKEDLINFAKDRAIKNVFLFRYCFLNTFKGRENFFLENSFKNMTIEYSQFIEMCFNLIKQIRPAVKRGTCHRIVSLLHAEAKRKFKLNNSRKKLTKRNASKKDSPKPKITDEVFEASKELNKVLDKKSNLDCLTDEEKLNILDGRPSLTNSTSSFSDKLAKNIETNILNNTPKKTLETLETNNGIDYILIEDSNSSD